MKLDKDHHGLGITIAGYTDQTGSFLGLHLLHCPFSLTVLQNSTQPKLKVKSSILVLWIWRKLLIGCQEK